MEHNCSIIIIRSKIVDYDGKKHLSSRIDEIKNECNICPSDGIHNKEYRKEIFEINKKYILNKSNKVSEFLLTMIDKDLVTFLKNKEIYFHYFEESNRYDIKKMKEIIFKYNIAEPEQFLDLLHSNKYLKSDEILTIKKAFRRNSLSNLNSDLFNV